MGWNRYCICILGEFVKKKIGILLGIIFVIIGIVFLFKITKIDFENKGALEYTLLEEEDIPQEINEEIQRYKRKGCKNSYICNEKLYILVCYGEQTVPGYVVEITDIYESSNRIFVKTTLKGAVIMEGETKEGALKKIIGNDKAKQKHDENELYPYIVIRVDRSDKGIVFI